MGEDLISRLFNWKKEVVINDITMYIRIVGDSAVEEARIAALTESRRLRVALRDKESDLYMAYMTEVEEFDDDYLKRVITNLRSREVVQEYVRRNPRPALPEQSDYPSLEEQEAYEEAKVERETTYMKNLQAYIEGWQDDYMKSLGKRKREQLVQEWKDVRINTLTETKFSEVFQDYVLFKSLFSDPDLTKPVFTDFKVFRNLPTQVKTVLRESYDELSVSVDEIKN